MRRLLFLVALLLVPGVALAQAGGMIRAPVPAPGPAPGPARVVGAAGAGCLAGAVELPSEAPGLKTVRASRSAFWGHPDAIAALKLLGARAQAAGLPTLLMNDVSNPRGGPMRGHASHQTGLNADVYLDLALPRPLASAAARDEVVPGGLVRPDQRGVDMARWKPGHVALLRLAAELPGVDRVLVNAAIKRQLCLEVPTSDRDWLRRIRPWYAHAAHMHIHFRCPAGQTECRDPAPIPTGDGCDASLQWWFDRLDEPPPPPRPPQPRPVPMVPAACGPIMTAPALVPLLVPARR